MTFKNIDDVGDFEVTCKKCGSKDIWIFYEEEFYDPGYDIDTHFVMSCRKCKNRVNVELGVIEGTGELA